MTLHTMAYIYTLYVTFCTVDSGLLVTCLLFIKNSTRTDILVLCERAGSMPTFICCDGNNHNMNLDDSDMVPFAMIRLPPQYSAQSCKLNASLLSP